MFETLFPIWNRGLQINEVDGLMRTLLEKRHECEPCLREIAEVGLNGLLPFRRRCINTGLANNGVRQTRSLYSWGHRLSRERTSELNLKGDDGPIC